MDSLTIDWARMPMYNTLMAIAAGVGLLLVVALARRVLTTNTPIVPEGWALAFGVLGFLLTATGLHMTLTWPLAAGGFAFDNIVFGEPALAFGAMLLAGALLLWTRGHTLNTQDDRFGHVAEIAGPMSVFVFVLGLAAFGVAGAGWVYGLFAAPPEEPITGLLAAYPLVETTFIAGLYTLTGVGCVLAPFALRNRAAVLLRSVGIAWGVAGLGFALFGALNYFTHIGLIVNTT